MDGKKKERLYGNENVSVEQWNVGEKENNEGQENIGQPIPKEEFEIVLKELKRNKATVIDNTSIKLLGATEGQGEETFKIIHDTCENQSSLEIVRNVYRHIY